jgi:hypothetical protein
MKKLFLFVMIILPAALLSQTVSNLAVIPGTPGSASTVTFDVEWDKDALPALWLDSMWVFVDYNKNGKMTRLLLSGGTLTEHSATKAGTGEFIYENDMGAWVYGDARTNTAGSFSAKVQLFTKEKDILIAGACAYASSYPPVSNWIDETKLGFNGTPMYEITLTDGSTTVTVEAGSTFLLPCSYTVSSFTDRTGAPGIINCKPPVSLALTASSATICEGQSTTLTASATDAAQYRIDNGAWQTEMDFNVSPVANASYTLYAQTAEGCVASVTNAAVVTVNPIPDAPTMGGEGNSYCTSGTITATPSNGDTGIRWTDNSSTISPRSVTASGTYYAVTTSAAGCESSPVPVSGTIGQPGTDGQPADPVCDCAEGTIKCGSTCKKDENYTLNDGACTGACNTAYRRLYNACGVPIGTNGTYTNTACSTNPPPGEDAKCTSETTSVSGLTTVGCQEYCRSWACGYSTYSYYLQGGTLCLCGRCNW